MTAADIPDDIPDHLRQFIAETGLPSGANLQVPDIGSQTSNSGSFTFVKHDRPPQTETTNQWVAAGEPDGDEQDEVELTPSAEERVDLLAQAAFLVSRERNAEYGEPLDLFTLIGQLWSTYLGLNQPIAPHDVAVMEILKKIARVGVNPTKADSWRDIAGYSACGWTSVPEDLRQSDD